METVNSPDYDAISSTELFNSFMDVVLAEEKNEENDEFEKEHTKTKSGHDMDSSTSTTNVTLESNSDDKYPESKTTNELNQKQKHSNGVLNHTAVQQPLPLYLKTSTEPIYEVCQTSSSLEKKVSQLQVTQEFKNSSSGKNLTPSEKSITSVTDEYAVPQKPPRTSINATTKAGPHDMVALPQCEPKTHSPDVGGAYDSVGVPQYVPNTTASNIASMYAVPDKTKTKNENPYADVTVFSSNKQNGVNPRPEPQPTSTEYEDISNFQQPTALNPRHENSVKLNAEQIAYGSMRYQSEGQKDMYSSITSTIERGNEQQLSPRSASTATREKKNFFGFGKKQNSLDSALYGRSHSEASQRWSAEIKHENSDGKSSPLLKRQSSIPIICSGYMFKQGGTGFTPKNWRLRWFELKKDNCLYYYKGEQDHAANGAVMLLKYSVTRAAEVNKRFAFKLVKGGARTYYFAANSDEEMRKWMKNISEAARLAVADMSIPECSLKNVSVPALSITEPDCHGFLHKQGDSRKSWKRRYCVLKYGCLFYYEDMSNEVAIGVFKLHHYTINKSPGVKLGFEAVPPVRKMRTYYFYAETDIDFKRWVEAMKHSVATFKT